MMGVKLFEVMSDIFNTDKICTKFLRIKVKYC